MTKEQFSKYINNFEFSELFRAQGWNNFNAEYKIEIKGTIFPIRGIVEKKGFAILLCHSSKDSIPDFVMRRQLEKKIRTYHFCHLLIFIDKNKTEQYWQLPLREDGKLKKLIQFSWRKGQKPEDLFQRLRNIVFTLDEEENLKLADVEERVNTLSTNSEKVTKKFYTEFLKQHQAFLGFIKGIDDALPDDENEKKQWYASLMLNRLMFCYFIQKKGFLDWNPKYLTDKLAECKKLKGKNNFYSFYRSFLLELFHNELGRPEDKRLRRVSPVSFGTIPYLNGGLFDVHELEGDYKNISIKDVAFEKIFAFFDEWNWHLDTRVTASGKDINPDVIGYIFEKYINQKEMGAYYTKEDITDYIGKNTIIPFLLDKAKSYYPDPFKPGYGFWQYLQDSGDEYIYESVKKGAEGLSSIDDVNIPKNIRIGIDTSKSNLLDRRKDWNTTTPDEIGLPTEIWRETIARLQRYFELKTKIKKGEIQDINDLITYNLNIRKLIQDYLEQTRDKEFIRKFYKALCEITILDPTCGSGAFLFAALNILEPLYEVCIQRMEEFFDANPNGNKDFEDKLVPIKSGDHPNMSYYIFKTIILNNLYGVDLMKEAVEIAKLRLFLKLVAEVDPSRRKKNYGLEPLPDIDFNIRAGNTLVGFATEKQLEEVVKEVDGNLIFEERFEELKSACKAVAVSYEHFQTVQVSISSDKYKEIKKSMSKELKTLDEKLNRYLADTYGLGKQTQWKNKKEKEDAYQDWKNRHRPFHWLAEFYEIISKGGFDVVIGNPPYVEYSSVKKNYQIKNYETEKAGNLYTYVIERSLRLMYNTSKIGMITQMSGYCTPRMTPYQEHLYNNLSNCFISFYDDRPGKLFDIEHIRVSIMLGEKGIANDLVLSTTNYIKFKSEFRRYVFDSIRYYKTKNSKKEGTILKISNVHDDKIAKKIWLQNNKLLDYAIDRVNDNYVYYGYGYGYFGKILTEKSYFKSKYINESTGDKYICFDETFNNNVFVALMNSTLFYWFYVNYSDGHNFTKTVITSIPFEYPCGKILHDLIEKNIELMKSLDKNAKIKYAKYKATGNVEYSEYYPKLSKPIIDEIDKILAKHYGFTEEELDFIINYDIKYRMGSELEGE